jgi:tetratricopeptide (TPR) repeat protein
VIEIKNYEDFIKEVEKDNNPIRVSSNPEEIVKKIRCFLPKMIVEWYKNGKLKIPKFFGRGEELSKVWEKFNEKSSGGVLSINGVGGIGKTTLAEVFLILKAIEGQKILAIYRKDHYLGYPLFNKLNLKEIEVHEVDSLTYTTLCEILAGVRGRIDYNDLARILDDKEVILFLDDLQFADDEVRKFVKRCEKRLSKSKIIITSRRFERIRGFKIEGLKKDYDDYVKHLASEHDISIANEEIETMRKITRGHPLLTEIIVKNYHRCKLPKVGDIPKTLSDDEFVKEFLDRLIRENIKGKNLKVLKILSVFRTVIRKDVLELLKVDEKITDDLIKWLMLRRVNGGYDFYDDTIKECVFGMLSDDERLEAHRRAVNYYKTFYEDYIKKRNRNFIPMVFEYLYHLVECGELKKALDVVFDEETFEDLRYNVNLEEFAKTLVKIHKCLDGYEKDKIALKIGHIYNAFGWSDKTIEILNDLKNLKESDEVERLRRLGYSNIRIGEFLNALKKTLKALTLASIEKDFKKGFRTYGYINLYLSNFRKSIHYFENAFETFPLAWIYYCLGDAYTRLGLLFNAFESFEKGIEDSKKSKYERYLASNLLGKGYVLTLLGKHKSALNELKEANKRSLNLKYFFLSHSYICLGIHYHIKNQIEEARKNYEEGLRRTTYDYVRAVALHNLGILHTDLNDLDKAKEHLKKAKEIFDKYGFTYGKAKVLHHLGVIEEIKGNFKQAEKLYEESLNLKDDLTKENREKIKNMLKEDFEFKEIVEKAKKRKIDVVKDFETKNVDKLGKAITLAQLGVLKIKQGRRDEALKLLREARAMFEEIFDDLMLKFNITPDKNPYLRLVNQALNTVFTGKTDINIIFRDFVIP